eukprot:749518-Hanusia_phi.AAC.1
MPDSCRWMWAVSGPLSGVVDCLVRQGRLAQDDRAVVQGRGKSRIVSIRAGECLHRCQSLQGLPSSHPKLPNDRMHPLPYLMSMFGLNRPPGSSAADRASLDLMPLMALVGLLVALVGYVTGVCRTVPCGREAIMEFQVEPTWNSFTVMLEGTCGVAELTREPDEDPEESEDLEERAALAEECQQLRQQWIDENAMATELEMKVKMVMPERAAHKRTEEQRRDRSRRERRALKRSPACPRWWGSSLSPAVSPLMRSSRGIRSRWSQTANLAGEAEFGVTVKSPPELVAMPFDGNWRIILRASGFANRPMNYRLMVKRDNPHDVAMSIMSDLQRGKKNTKFVNGQFGHFSVRRWFSYACRDRLNRFKS